MRNPRQQARDEYFARRDDRYAIVALAPQVWDEQWVNRQQLLSRVGRHHDVMYSTGGWFLWDRHSPEWRAARWRGDFRQSDNVWVDESPRYLLRWPRIAALDRLIMREQVRRWTRWAQSHGGRGLVAHICHPRYFPYVDLLEPDRIVYHVYDLYDHQPGWQAEWEAQERMLLERAHLVFCPSQMLADALYRKVQRKVEVLPNAADVEAFFEAAVQNAGEPTDLADVPHPRVGWIGSVHPQIDFGLVAELAQRHPDWHFVFVGNKVPYTEAQAEREFVDCARLPNVHFLGYKHRTEVPSYVLHMDVNMMCYRVADERWVKLAYPLKLHEYLAAGRPVVSVDLEMIRVHDDVIRFANGVDEWERAILEALRDGGVGTPSLRKAVAREHSWDVRAKQLLTWLDELGGSAMRVGNPSPSPA